MNKPMKRRRYEEFLLNCIIGDMILREEFKEERKKLPVPQCNECIQEKADAVIDRVQEKFKLDFESIAPRWVVEFIENEVKEWVAERYA